MNQHYVLKYEYTDDYMERRGPFRAEHLAQIQKAVDDGYLLLAGVTPKGPGAVLTFFCDSEEKVHEFARQDSYSRAGLIRNLTVDRLVVAGGIESVMHPAANYAVSPALAG